MISVIDHTKMGREYGGWLDTHYHFSFANYFNPNNMNFGTLRVVNDDTFAPDSGFPTHPHENMEIISYVVDGILTHKDSMGNEQSLVRGQVQYMSAGTGVTHSEYNLGDYPLRILQIWILPDRLGHEPAYGDHQFEWNERVNTWLKIVSSKQGDAPVKINQEMDISVVVLHPDQEITYTLPEGHQAYVIQIEGEGMLNKRELVERDAAEVRGESTLTFKATTHSHYMVFDMPEQEAE